MPRTLRTEEIPRLEREEYRDAAKVPLVLVLDNIRSQFNTGSVFRSADVFRSERLVLCGITATPPQREMHKAALGATDTVAWEYSATTTDAVGKLREEGYRIAALELAEGSVDIRDIDLSASDRWAVVLGNEVDGISDEVMDMVDLCIEIPQAGTKHSLNVAIAAGIVQWEFFRAFSHLIA